MGEGSGLSPVGPEGHRRCRVRVEPADLCGCGFRVSQLLAIVHSCSFSEPSPHISAAFLSCAGSRAHGHTHAGPLNTTTEGFWKCLQGLPCTEGGLQLREGRILSQSHTAYLGQGPDVAAQVSLSSHYPLPCPLHSAPLGPLFPVLGNFSLPPLGFVGGEAEGKGHLWL